MNFKKTLNKIWHFIWDEDSIWSWLANIVLAFILIKFVVYPALGFALGTQFPIVAVVSGSMEHKTAFETWWNTECCTTQQCNTKNKHEEIYKKHEILKEKFVTFPFTSGFNKGDIMILRGANEAKQGDVIVFLAEGRNDPIIHRLVRINNNKYTTLGDNNCGSIADFEKNIPTDKVIGKAYIKIPLLGWLKIFFVDLLHLMKVI